MANTPVVAVSRPDLLGWRRVTIEDRAAGKARSYEELRKILRGAGLASDHKVEWVGGGKEAWPDRTYICQILGIFMAVYFLATACLLIKIGVKDAFGAPTLLDRATGAILILAALLEIVAAGAAVYYWKTRKRDYSGAIVLIGNLISLAVSLVVVLAQFWLWAYMDYLPLWIVFMLWSIVALVILVYEGVWRAIKYPRRIAVGAVASALFAVVNAAYSQMYLPYTASPLVQSSAAFGKPVLGGGEMYLPVHLRVKNASRVPVYIIGSIYWIHGGLVGAGPRWQLIHDGEFVQPRSLQPGEELSNDELIELKRPDWGRYEVVQVNAELWMLRMDRMTVSGEYSSSGRSLTSLKAEGRDRGPRGPNEDYFRYQADISSSNEILNFARRRERLTLWYAHRKDWPFLYIDVGLPGERIAFDPFRPNENMEAIKRYGLKRVRSSIVLKPFAELLEGAKVEPSKEPPKETSTQAR
ncbi:Yip1 family protein [Streptomyces sp. NPDC032472]|uniref:Yip1 family protein n=1 Tax=Streptomyces sp. NPDC032472 TaxID=3155018 RepID=UPI0033DC5521